MAYKKIIFDTKMVKYNVCCYSTLMTCDSDFKNPKIDCFTATASFLYVNTKEFRFVFKLPTIIPVPYNFQQTAGRIKETPEFENAKLVLFDLLIQKLETEFGAQIE